MVNDISGGAGKLVQISLSGGANASELEAKVKSALGASVHCLVEDARGGISARVK